jgi:PmbA protein
VTDVEEQVLERARAAADAAEVFGVESARTEVAFRAGQLRSQETRLVRGIGLRVIRDGRTGFASSTNPDAVEELVVAAVETAALGRRAGFSLPPPQRLPRVSVFDNRVMLVPPVRLVEWGADLVSAMKSRVPDMKLDIQFSRTYRQVNIANTAGLSVGYEQALFDLTATGLLVFPDGLFWVSDYVNLAGGEPLVLEPVADRLTALARQARHKAVLKSGTLPVLLMPTAVPSLLLPLEVGVNGKQREKGTTPLLGREETRVLDAKLTVADNGLRSYAPGSASCDGEGLPRRRNVLFERGVFGGFLYDLTTAAACGGHSTGSAGRDYSGPPTPATTNIELLAGTARLDETVAAMREGLIVHEFIGGGQSNLLAGEVALNVSCGYRVENGTVTGRVKDAMVAGNVYEILTRVEAVGDTLRDLGQYAVPFLMLAGLKVAAGERRG